MDVKLENLFFNYNPDLSSHILRSINLDIKSGEFLLIAGRNGSGKTTLAQIAAGLIKPTKGKVYFNANDISSPSDRKPVKNVGMIFQTPEQQLFERTVFEDVTYVLELEGILDKAEITKRAQETLTLVGLDFEKYKGRLSFNLSSGEKRKAAIACILINSPDLIIFDEPTAGLDFSTRKSMVDVISKLRDNGKTIICISHNIDCFLDISDKIIVLKAGKIIFDGDKTMLFDRYDDISGEVRLPKILEVLKQLKDMGAPVNTDKYSSGNALEHLKRLAD